MYCPSGSRSPFASNRRNSGAFPTANSLLMTCPSGVETLKVTAACGPATSQRTLDPNPVMEANGLSSDWAKTALQAASISTKQNMEGGCFRFFIVKPSLSAQVAEVEMSG